MQQQYSLKIDAAFDSLRMLGQSGRPSSTCGHCSRAANSQLRYSGGCSETQLWHCKSRKGHFHRWGCVGHLAALEAPSRPLAFRGGCVCGPCRRLPLLLRREGLLGAGARLVLPLEEVALAAIPVLGAPEEHPAKFHCPQEDDLS